MISLRRFPPLTCCHTFRCGPVVGMSGRFTGGTRSPKMTTAYKPDLSDNCWTRMYRDFSNRRPAIHHVAHRATIC